MIKAPFTRRRAVAPADGSSFSLNPLREQRGISLVELLLALALVSLIITVVSMAYFAGLRAWQRAENQMEVQQNLRIAMNILSTEIRKASTFEIEPDGHGISLTYCSNPSKVYRLHKASDEIRMYAKGTTVARYIENCEFFYDNDLLRIEITSKTMEGVVGRTYALCINTRGKDNDG